MTQRQGRVMQRATWALLLAALLCLLPCHAARAATPADLGADELAQRIEAYVAEHEETTAGLAVAVFDAQDTLYEGFFGYANREEATQLGPDSVVEWGSTTKLLIWVSAMQLVERGWLDLDADVREYLPSDFATQLELAYPVSMRNLMNHQGGFQEVVFDVMVAGDAYPHDLGDALLRHVPPQIFRPGEVTAYSNWGAALAAYVVERVSGERFCDYVHEHVFEPLGMEHTALYSDLSDNSWVEARRHDLACYTAAGKPLGECLYHIPIYPAGMATGTLADFRSFAQALLREDSPLFAEATTRAELFEPTSLMGASGAACNRHGFWDVPYGVTLTGHGGNTMGCSSYLLLDLAGGTGIVIMTNQEGEEVYNVGLVEELYGAFDPATAQPGRTLPKGIYRSARTTLRGPAKLESAGYVIFSDELQEEFWEAGVLADGRRVVRMTYGDLIEVSLPRFVLELGLLALWALGAVWSLAYLVLVGLRLVVRRVRGKELPVAAGRRARLGAAGFSLGLVGLLALGVWTLVNSLPSSVFQVVSVLVAVLAAVMVAQVATLRRALGAEERRFGKFLDVAALVFLCAAVANVAYWDLFQFWAV